MLISKVKIAKYSLIAPSVITLVVFSSSGLLRGEAPASATTSLPTQCTDELLEGVKEFGTDTPVVLVHGYNSNPKDTWEDGTGNNVSIISFLGKAKYAKVALEFDYSRNARDWVDRPDTGMKLALTIGCIGERSLHNNGPGKVIIIGHSMGGLMARYAYGHTLPWGVKTSRYMAKVITAGTPNKGTTLEVAKVLIGSTPSALVFGSKQLSALPEYDKDFPVYAIAGNIYSRLTAKTPWPTIQPYVERAHGNDAYVSVGSASGGNWTARYGGGNFVYKCYRQLIMGKSGIKSLNPAKESDLPCHHINIQKSGVVANEIVKSIERYTTVLQRESQTSPSTPTSPPVGNSVDFHGLNLYPGKLTGGERDQPNSEGTEYLFYNGPTGGRIMLAHNPKWENGQKSMYVCYNEVCPEDGRPLQPAPFDTIGGVKASTAVSYSPGAYVWYFPGPGVAVQAIFSPDEADNYTQTELYKVIQSMSWK